YQRLDVRPRYAPTVFAWRNRRGSSIAVLNASAPIGPTPGMRIRRRHSSSRRTNSTTTLCSRTYSCHSAAGAQHTIGKPGDQRIIGHELTHPRFELAATHLPDPQSECLDRMPDCILHVEEFSLEIAPLCQQEPKAIALLALDMDLPEPAGAHDVSNPARVRSVGFVAHRRQRGARMPSFKADRRPAALLELDLQPRRQ